MALVGFVARSAGCLQGLGESVASLARAAQATSAAILLAAPAVIRQEFRLNTGKAIASGTVCSYYYISPAMLFLSVLFAGLILFLSVLFNLNLNLNCTYIAGTVLGLYEDSRYKSEWKKVHLKQVDLIGLGSDPEVDQKLHHGNHLSSGVILARDLVNSPTNVLTPGQYSSQ